MSNKKARQPPLLDASGGYGVNMKQRLQKDEYSPKHTDNYTLPGVINYLTSEFTNLERFKIMTNLEKTEMKHSIIQLQSEINTLKIENLKQKNTIERLEKENRYLRNGSSCSDTVSEPDEISLSEVPKDMCDIDLSVIRDSKQRLAQSMKEILDLLKTPSSSLSTMATEVEDFNKYDALVASDQSDVFYFNNAMNERIHPLQHRNFKDSISSNYFDGQTDNDKQSIPMRKSKNNGASILDESSNLLDIINIKPLDLTGNQGKEQFPSIQSFEDTSDAETICDSQSLQNDQQQEPNTKDHQDESRPRPNLVKFPSLDTMGLNSHDSNRDRKDSSFFNWFPKDKNCVVEAIFANPLDDIVFLLMDSESREEEKSIDFWSSNSASIIHSQLLSKMLNTTEQLKIVEIHEVFYNSQTQETGILILTDTAVYYAFGKCGTSLSCMELIKYQNLKIRISDFVRYDDRHESYRVAILADEFETDSTVLKVYDLALSMHDSTVEEVCSRYNTFFKLPDSSEAHELEQVHWYRLQAEEKRGSLLDRTDYGLILKLSAHFFTYNLLLMDSKYVALPEDLKNAQVCCYRDNLALFSKCGEKNTLLYLFEISLDTVEAHVVLDTSEVTSKQVTILKSSGSYKIAFLSGSHLEIYDVSLKLECSKSLTAFYDGMLLSKLKIFLKKDRDPNDYSIIVYDIDF